MLRSEAIKVVLDTSVVVSGLMAKKKNSKKSESFLILRWFEARHFLLEFNSSILAEYQRVLDEKAKAFVVDGSDVGKYLELVRKAGCIDRILIRPPIYVSSDPSDNIYFDSQNCLFADYLVTKNTKHFNEDIRRDLLKINSRLKICSPSEFVAHLKS